MRGAFGFQILNYQRMYYENAKPEIQYNRLNSAFDKVYGKTQLKDDQRYVSYYVEDGDYWKIDNVTLGYTFKLYQTEYHQKPTYLCFSIESSYHYRLQGYGSGSTIEQQHLWIIGCRY